MSDEGQGEIIDLQPQLDDDGLPIFGSGGRKDKPARKPNQYTRRLLIRRLQELYPDYQPVIRMAKHAHRLTEIADEVDGDAEVGVATKAVAHQNALAAHNAVARYLMPQLKSQELSMSDNIGSVEIVIKPI